MLAVSNTDATKLQNVVLHALRFSTTHDVIQTPVISGALVDGVFCKNGVLTGVFEIKCWQNTNSNIKRFSGGLWFVDKSKFENMQHLSKSLCVPSYLITHVESYDFFTVFCVCDKHGKFQFSFAQKKITMKNTTFGDNAVMVDREIVEFNISYGTMYSIK